MKAKNVKIGMKVVPHSKTAGIANSGELSEAQRMKQPYLFVVGKALEYIGKPWILAAEENALLEGDYFVASDFTRYKEPKESRADLVKRVKAAYEDEREEETANLISNIKDELCNQFHNAKNELPGDVDSLNIDEQKLIALFDCSVDELGIKEYKEPKPVQLMSSRKATTLTKAAKGDAERVATLVEKDKQVAAERSLAILEEARAEILGRAPSVDTSHTKIGLNELAASLHADSVDKGFYSEPVNIGECLALIHSEVSEAFDADRAGNSCGTFCDASQITDETLELYYKAYIKGTFEDEIADIIISALNLAAYKGVDIEKHIALKQRYNKTRPVKHGKKY